MYKKTKIVCTIGPASSSQEILEGMLRAGMNVARFNFSHGTHEEHQKRIETVRAASVRTGIPVALMLDTKGREVRLGHFENGTIEMKKDQEFTLTPRDVVGNERICSINYSKLCNDVKPGDHILLCDGLVKLQVTSVEGEDIHTVILNDGPMGDRKRVAVPGAMFDLPAVSSADQADIEFAIKLGMDFISASFMRSGKDILAIRKILERHGSPIKIIAKVESKAASENIDEILQMADGIMVGRGDLGVDLPPEKVPKVQKSVIRKCQMAGKPVITATQMMESMVNNPRPTRAETSDVANAILDGTDAIMLSSETAGGSYPIQAVQTMSRVAIFTEQNFPVEEVRYVKDNVTETTTESISKATVKIAEDLHAAAILAPTERGGTAQMISKYRPESRIIAISPHEDVIRRLQLCWNVTAIQGKEAGNSDEVVDNAIYAAVDDELVQAGDLVVLTAGVPVGKEGGTNMIRVQVVGDILLHGTGVGRNTAIGPVCLATDTESLKKNFKDGCVLVMHSAEEEWSEYIKKAGAVISEENGLASEAAVLAITLGIPTVIGAKQAVDILENGEMVTVDSSQGTIYRGVTNAR